MELQKKMEELGTAFEAFKKANDQRLDEIAKKGEASSATTERVEKISKDMGALEAKIDELKTALNRTPNGGGETEQDKKAFEMREKFGNEFKSFMREGGSQSREVRDFLKKAMSIDSDMDGGFLVSSEMSSEIVKKVQEANPVRELASKQTISTNQLDILVDNDVAGYSWAGETEAQSETTSNQLREVSIPAHIIYAYPKATQSVLDDAAINLEAWLTGKVSEAFNLGENIAFIDGNGVKKPKGILSYASGTSFGQIERVETGTNTLIAADDLISVQTALKEAYQPNASWLINRTLIGVLRKLKDVTSGQYLWQPGLQPNVPNLLLGRPVYMAPQLPSAFAVTTDLIIYGDIRAGYQIVDRMGVRVIRDNITAIPYVKFNVQKRVGGGVKDFEAIKVLRGKT